MTRPVPEASVPVACPDCLSGQIKGPDQPGTGLAYWRCLKCGVVWNPERPPDRTRTRPSPRKNNNGLLEQPVGRPLSFLVANDPQIGPPGTDLFRILPRQHA